MQDEHGIVYINVCIIPITEVRMTFMYFVASGSKWSGCSHDVEGTACVRGALWPAAGPH